jgi:hypothetical protein
MLNTTQGRGDPPESARSSTISREKLETLEDLLRAIRQSDPEGGHLTKMLGTTAAHLVDHLGVPPDKILIRTLLGLRPGLRVYLRERRYLRNSIRSYVNYVRILVNKARELGWVECSPELVAAWHEIRQATKKRLGTIRLIEYAIANGLAPADFMESHLTNWTQAAIRAGRSYESVRMVKAGFRRLIFEAGLGPKIPGLRPPVDSTYGVPFNELPNPLHDQVVDLLKWKTAEFAPERPQRAKNRPITAENLKREICRIYGFVTRVLGKKVSTLSELLSQESITSFVGWCMNERKLCGRSVEIDLGRICGLRAYPPLAGLDFTWVLKLMAQLPKRREAEIQEKKDAKWLPYDVLDGIPDLIRRDAVRD